MPDLYPKQIVVNEQSILRLEKTLKSAYADIVDEITGATSFGTANRRAILKQIEGILTGLGVDVDTFLRKELTTYYKIGADESIRQLQNIGAEVNVAEGFNRVHKDAIASLVDDAATAFGESMSGVNRSAQLLLGRAVREAITQRMATSLVSGDALRNVKQMIVGLLQQNGLDALKDKGGNSWTLDRYAEMLFRTKAVEARNRGVVNRMAENGYDLVQVSSHGATDVCGDWEGKILSISGETTELDGEPVATVAEAEADGLFHPNCRHALNVLIPSLANETGAYDNPA